MGLAVGGPIGALVGGVTPVFLARGLQALGEHYRRKQEARASFVIAKAATLAGVEVSEIVQGLTTDPKREELLLRTLRAAEDAALAEKLLAFAHTLANGYQNDSDEVIAWESIFVHVLEDCSVAHLDILRTFLQTENQLGLGDGSTTFDKAPEAINREQLRTVRPEYDSFIDSLVSKLESHGLLQGATSTSGMGFSLGPKNVTYRITPFGRQFLERISMVQESLRIR